MSNAFAFILAVLIGLVFPLVAVGGYWQSKTKEYIIRAADLAVEHKYKQARDLMIFAAKLNPSLTKIADVQALYDIILSESSAASILEINRIREAAPDWPKARLESIWANGAVRICAVIFIILSILIRAIHLF